MERNRKSTLGKALIYMLVFFLFPAVLKAQVYYISPTGNDNSSGTKERPWKTVNRAIKASKPNVTLIFENGSYEVRNSIVIKNVNASKGRLVLKARNKGRVKFIFDNFSIQDEKFSFLNCRYINIDGISFFSRNKNNGNTKDILLAIRNSSNINVINCHFSNSFEEGLKVSYSKFITVKNNFFEGFDHEGIDFLNVDDSEILNNSIFEVGRVGIMVKGGSDNVRIYNNFIRNESTNMTTAGITIGGMTGKSSAKSYKKGSYEASNIIAANNIISAVKSGNILSGVSFFGSNNSYLINCKINGTKNGILMQKNNSKSYGWEEDVDNANVSIYQNDISSKNNKFDIKNRPAGLKISEGKKVYTKAVSAASRSSNTNDSVVIRGVSIDIGSIINDKFVGAK